MKTNIKFFRRYFVSIIIFIFAICGISTYYIFYQPFRKSIILIENKFQQNCDVVFVGDSITDMCKLNNYYPTNWGKILNRGICSDTIEDVTNRYANTVAPLNPKSTILLIGINNIIRDVCANDALISYQKLLMEIEQDNPDTKLYVLSVFPVANKYLKYNSTIIKFNSNLKKLCEQNNIEYIDVHSSLIDDSGKLNNDYTNDGLHYTPLGYSTISKTIISKINSNLIIS